MVDSDFELFAGNINDLASGYLRKLEGEELATYFRWMTRFPIEIVLKAINRAPEIYPQFFPTAGLIVGICEQITIDAREYADSVRAIQTTAQCQHEYEFEPEPEGGLYLGFYVCKFCGRAYPKPNPKAPPKQLRYLRILQNPNGERSGGDQRGMTHIGSIGGQGGE